MLFQLLFFMVLRGPLHALHVSGVLIGVRSIREIRLIRVIRLLYQLMSNGAPVPRGRDEPKRPAHALT